MVLSELDQFLKLHIPGRAVTELHRRTSLDHDAKDIHAILGHPIHSCTHSSFPVKYRPEQHYHLHGRGRYSPAYTYI